VLIDGADIIAEQKGQTTNLQALLENIEKNSSAPTETEAKAPDENTTSKPIRLMIKKFSFINNKASLETEQWDPQVLKVPNIVMNNLGDEKVGLTPEQLSAEVINRLIKSVETAAKEALKEKAKEEAKKALTEQLDKNLSDEDKAKLDSLKNVFGQ
jgi:vancomycin resistance protein YoaR